MNNETRAINWANEQKKLYKRGLLSLEKIKLIEKNISDWYWYKKTEIYKTKLLELAKANAKKPSRKAKNMQERLLAEALRRYTKQYHYCFDQIFYDRLFVLRPNWFQKKTATSTKKLRQPNSSTLTTAEKKEKLLKMAKQGRPKPSCGQRGQAKNGLVAAFYRYTNPNDKSYDIDFAAAIRETKSGWLLDEKACALKLDAKAKQKTLFELAASEALRPSRTRNGSAAENQIARALCRWTNKNDEDYDQNFDLKIKQMAPSWFKSDEYISKKLTTTEKRDMLMVMASDPNAKKPSKRSKDLVEQQLARALLRWTNKKDKSYNAVFDTVMRQKRPDWCCLNNI